jgi:Ferritin-like domain
VTGAPTKGDIDILQFLCAAEQIETDLWEQYKEMGEGNPQYAEALQSVLDDNVVTYAADTTEDERSHDKFIAAYLKSIGVMPVDLKPFRTIPSPNIKGGNGRFRVNNLTGLSIDTSYYTRYHDRKNPDFGKQPGQLAEISKQSAIPTQPKESEKALLGMAGVAGLHFASIEQAAAASITHCCCKSAVRRCCTSSHRSTPQRRSTSPSSTTSWVITRASTTGQARS